MRRLRPMSPDPATVEPVVEAVPAKVVDREALEAELAKLLHAYGKNELAQKLAVDGPLVARLGPKQEELLEEIRRIQKELRE